MKIIKDRKLKRLVVSISLILFLISLTQNSYFITGMKESVGSFGLIALLFGWMGIFGAGISWIANPLLLISWRILFTEKWKLSFILSFSALFFSLIFLLFNEIIANEGGSKSSIIAYDTGYWLWLSSCGINFIGNLIFYRKQIKEMEFRISK
ncbi:hypothetical protein [Tenacibaculum crassostreae]|uniref:hypothetical protein n=1 Tax=Tenacibaculum crassostreae TaxID=502683 RepID=UPI0038966B26